MGREMRTELRLSETQIGLRSTALTCLGKPYQYGARRWDGDGELPSTFDCSSFVHALYLKYGYQIPKRSIEQAASGSRVTGAFEVGDLIFFRSDVGYYNPQFPDGIGHVMMYYGIWRNKKYIIGACGTFPYKRKRVDRVSLVTLDRALHRGDFRVAKRIL